MGRGGRWAAALLFLSIATVWGYNWVVMKRALDYAGPFTFSAWRFLLASAGLFGALAALRRPWRIRPMGSVALVGLLQTGGNFGFSMWALRTGPAGGSALLCYTMPFWVTLLAWPTLGERPARIQWVATAVAAAGLVLVLRASPGKERIGADVLATLAGLSWGAGVLVAKRMQAGNAVDPLALTAWQMLFGGLALLAAALLVPSRPTAWTPYLFFALFYNVGPVNGFAWLLWFWLLARMEAGLASLGVLATPVMALAFGALELGERPRGAEAAGMALIGLALVLVAPLSSRALAAGRRRSGEARA